MADSEFVERHYLSEEHCVNANRVLLRAGEPEDRALARKLQRVESGTKRAFL